MKARLLAALALMAFVVFGMGNIAFGQDEVTEKWTGTGQSTSKVIQLEEGKFYVSYESFGIGISDTGEGLFHKATARALGFMLIENGIIKEERGYGVLNIVNGDKIFYTYEVSGDAKPGVESIATVKSTYTGGTGKCAGIQGGGTSTRYSLKPAMEGIGQSYSKGTAKYKLP